MLPEKREAKKKEKKRRKKKLRVEPKVANVGGMHVGRMNRKTANKWEKLMVTGKFMNQKLSKTFPSRVLIFDNKRHPVTIQNYGPLSYISANTALFMPHNNKLPARGPNYFLTSIVSYFFPIVAAIEYR